MSDDVQFLLYSPTLGTLDLTASFDTYGYMLYGAQFGVATAATSTADALIGQSVSSSGFTVRDDVSFYVRVESVRATNDGKRLSDGCAAIERWHRATDAEFRYKPRGGAWSCLPIIVDPRSRRGGLKVASVPAPVGGVDVVVDEWNDAVRWLQLTLTCAPFVLAASETTSTVSLASSVGSLTVVGAGDAAATVTLGGANALDKCLVYLAPAMPAFSPLLRSHMAAGGATLDRSGQPAFYSTTWRALSGKVASIDGSNLPAGGYAVVAHLFNNTTAQSLQIPITITANGITTTALSAPVDLPASGTLFEGIAGFVLPETDDTVTITFGTVANVYVDEVFILPMIEGSSLNLLDSIAGLAKTISAPLTSNQRWVPPVEAIESAPPLLTAESMTVVVASAGNASPSCTISYRPAALTFTQGEEDTA